MKRKKLKLGRDTLLRLDPGKLEAVVGGTSETCPALCGHTSACSVIICCSLTGGSAACSVLPPFTCFNRQHH